MRRNLAGLLLLETVVFFIVGKYETTRKHAPFHSGITRTILDFAAKIVCFMRAPPRSQGWSIKSPLAARQSPGSPDSMRRLFAF